MDVAREIVIHSINSIPQSVIDASPTKKLVTQANEVIIML